MAITHTKVRFGASPPTPDPRKTRYRMKKHFLIGAVALAAVFTFTFAPSTAQAETYEQCKARCGAGDRPLGQCHRGERRLEAAVTEPAQSMAEIERQGLHSLPPAKAS